MRRLPRSPLHVRQAVDLRAILWEMQGILQDYCTRFWGTLGTVQCARGLLATPFPLCSMSLGVHLSAPPDNPRYADV